MAVHRRPGSSDHFPLAAAQKGTTQHEEGHKNGGGIAWQTEDGGVADMAEGQWLARLDGHAPQVELPQ